MKFTFTRHEGADSSFWLSREYLLTNGLGGYASGTLADCLTRKYHGLLALPEERGGRLTLFLSKVELSILSGTNQYDLSTNLFPKTIFPEGHRFIQAVEIDDFPMTEFAVGNGHNATIRLRKSVLMPRGEKAVLLRYELVSSPKPVVIKLMPFLAYRDVNGLAHQNADLRPRTFFETNGFKIDPYPGLPPLFMHTSKTSTFYPSPDWWKAFEYPEERERGYEFSEDLFTPGVFEVKLKQGEAVTLRAALDSVRPAAIDASWEKELGRLKRLKAEGSGVSEPLAGFKLRAEQYVTDAPAGILAGFPWFATEWGRDAFISLPGLLLSRGRLAEAFALLERYAEREKSGLIPNIVSAAGDHAYNAVDTPFLFCRAAQRYLAAGGKRDDVRKKLLPAMERVVAAFAYGRSAEGRIGEDGLLYAGSEKTQLTWMDAQIHSAPVTPRHGAAVEINALYYNALVFLLEEFRDALTPVNKERFEQLRRLFETNFEKRFWSEADGCLCDVYRSENDRDTSIRPNQLFAVGLPACAVSADKARLLLETVKLHLVTPYGLRTLSPRDQAFTPLYRGGQDERDRAYHQGPVWPWLIGVFYDALLRQAEDPAAAKRYVRSTFAPLWDNTPGDGCVGHLAEIFSALDPHTPGGCPAQAWSLAETIRVLEETK